MLTLNDFSFLNQTPKDRRRIQHQDENYRSYRSRHFPAKKAGKKGARIVHPLPILKDDLPCELSTSSTTES